MKKNILFLLIFTIFLFFSNIGYAYFELQENPDNISFTSTEYRLNYTILPPYEYGIWEVKHGNPATKYNITFNTTENNDCWQYSSDHIELKIVSIANTFNQSSYPMCYNGTQWRLVGTKFSSTAITSSANGDSGDVRIYVYDNDYDTSAGWVTSASEWQTNLKFFASFSAIYDEQMYWQSAGSINVSFYDEETRNPIQNVTYSIISDGFSYSGNTTTGNFYLDLSGYEYQNYEIRYVSDGYDIRSYYIDENSLSSSINYDLYLLSENSSSPFILTVTNKENQPISGLTASLLRRYVIDNQTQYKTVEMMKPAVALGGSTPFYAVANTIPYLFRIQNSAGEVIFQGAGTSNNFDTIFLISQEIFIKVNEQSSPFQASLDLENLYTLITNTSSHFWLSYNDVDGTIGYICLEVKINNTEVMGQTCTDDNSGVISVAYPATHPKNGSYYIARAKAQDLQNGNFSLVEILAIDFRDYSGVNIFGILGIFMLIITLIFIFVAFAGNPAIAIMLGAMAIVAFGINLLGLITLAPVLQGTIIAVSIILAYMMRDK